VDNEEEKEDTDNEVGSEVVDEEDTIDEANSDDAVREGTGDEEDADNEEGPDDVSSISDDEDEDEDEDAFITERREDVQGKEHLAGPSCTCNLGYSGWRIGAEEMRHSVRTQCLSAKLSTWKPEADDEAFEKEAKHCFVTGISVGGVDEMEVSGVEPVRHGFSDGLIDNNTQDSVRAALT